MAGDSSVGNTINALTLLLTVVYLTLVIAHFNGKIELAAFGTNWDADAFCIGRKGTAFDSHLVCLYTDIVWAAVLYVISRVEWSRSEIAEPLHESAPSVLMHGLAHGLLWYQATYYGGLGTTSFIFTMGGLLEKAASLAIVAGFFFAFVHNQLSSSVMLSFLQAAVHSVVVATCCPPKLLFTYVNTVIFFNLTGSQLLGFKGPKDVFYDLSSGVGALVMLFTWLEPLTCDGFLINWGGHAWFDNSITFGTFAYYLAAKRLPARTAASLKAA